MDVEKKRKQRDWEREVQRMREEFLHLHAADRKWGSDELIVDPLVARRRGSIDTLDVRRMKTMYTSSSHDSPVIAHRRYRLRFDLAGFDVDSIRVAVSTERIVVRATRVLDSGQRQDYMRKVIERTAHRDARHGSRATNIWLYGLRKEKFRNVK